MNFYTQNQEYSKDQIIRMYDEYGKLNQDGREFADTVSYLLRECIESHCKEGFNMKDIKSIIFEEVYSIELDCLLGLLDKVE